MRKKCSVGNAIHDTELSEYTPMFESQFESNTELSYEKVLEVYNSIYSKMTSLGYTKEYLDMRYPNRNTRESIALYSERDTYKSIREHDRKYYTLKVLIRRNSEYDYVSVETQLAKLGALIQNILILEYQDMRYINLLRKKLNHTLSKVCETYLKPYFSGYVIADILCNPVSFDETKMTEITDTLNKYLPILNAGMESCSVGKIFLDRGNNVMNSDYNLYVGTVNRDIFPKLLEKYQAVFQNLSDTVEILTSDNRASIHLILMKKAYKQKDIVVKIAQKESKWVIGIFCRNSINPYLVLKTLFPKVKIHDIYHNSYFVLLDTYKDLNRVESSTPLSKGECQICTSPTYYSCTRKTITKECPKCTLKKYMSIFIKNT